LAILRDAVAAVSAAAPASRDESKKMTAQSYTSDRNVPDSRLACLPWNETCRQGAYRLYGKDLLALWKLF